MNTESAQIVHKKIRSIYDGLPPNQKTLAEYILDHLEEIPFLNTKELAEKGGTSTATVVRFAQRLDYSGYPALRREVSKALRQELNVEYVSRIETLEGDVLERVAHQDVADINETLNMLDRGDFQKAVQFLTKAKRIHTAGLGISYLMAGITAYQLNQVGLNAGVMRQGFTNFLEQAVFFDKDDVLLVLSYPPYPTETITLTKLAREAHIPVVAITNKRAAPVSFHANITLAVSSENVLFTNSFAALSVIINALATECAHHEKHKAQRMLEHLERINAQNDEPSK
jgi:DNA-binding MurR/RpiR family transcriptional regulator